MIIINSKKALVPFFALVLAGGILAFSVSPVFAHSSEKNWTELVDVLAQKFNLDRNQVQTVVEEFHNSKRTKMMENAQSRQEARLNKLVQDGKLTEAQKKAILDKMAELKTKYPVGSMQDLTPEQRQEKFKALQDEMKTWAESQGIDLSLLMSGRGMGHMKGWWQASRAN